MAEGHGVARLIVRRSALAASRGHLSVDGLVFDCAIGQAGTTILKREGDGASPVAAMRILGGYFRDGPLATAARQSRLGLQRIDKALGWCDAAFDRNYNCPVRLPYPASNERMWRDDHQYDVCLVLDWNVSMRRRGCGSAIFMHLARPGFRPTAGCVAVAPSVMRLLLAHLSRQTIVDIRR